MALAAPQISCNTPNCITHTGLGYIAGRDGVHFKSGSYDITGPANIGDITGGSSGSPVSVNIGEGSVNAGKGQSGTVQVMISKIYSSHCLFIP